MAVARRFVTHGLMILVAIAVGCGKPAPDASFRRMLKKANGATPVDVKGARYQVLENTIAYDVRSTTSLVSPYVADLSMDVLIHLLDDAGQPRKSETQKWKVHYAYQDGRWIQKAYEVKLPHLAYWKEASEDYVGNMQRVTATVIDR